MPCQPASPNSCHPQSHIGALTPPHRAPDNDPFARKIKRRQYRQPTCIADIEGAAPTLTKQSVDYYRQRAEQRKAQGLARQQAQHEYKEAAGQLQVGGPAMLGLVCGWGGAGV